MNETEGTPFQAPPPEAPPPPPAPPPPAWQAPPPAAPDPLVQELSWPLEYPLAQNEMSFLLPHLIKDGRGRLDVYFNRVYNPVAAAPRRIGLCRRR